MVDVTVKNLTEVQQYLKGLPVDAFTVAKKEIARTLMEVDTKVKTTSDLSVRTGNLFKSLQINVGGSSLKDLHASYFTGSIYAPTHEYGATIRARDKYLRVPGGPYLNIPTAANKTAAGVTRLQAREVFNMGGYISGKGVYLGEQLMFTLHKSVTIKARLKMIETTENEVPTLLSRIAAGIGES